MTLGEGIFYSSLVLGIIGLSNAAKGRWNWKKIILWPSGVVAVAGWPSDHAEDDAGEPGL